MQRVHRRLLALTLLVPLFGAQLGAQTRTTVRAGTIGTVPSPITAPTARVGPAPVGLAVTGTPAMATATWQPAPNAVSYSIERWLTSNPTCCRNSAASITTTSWKDDNGMLQWSGVYAYALRVTYTDGSVGTAQLDWTRPEPANPATLTATQKGEGVVELAWPVVADASYYVLWGPGLGTGLKTTGSSHVVSSVPAGVHEYRVAAYYEPGPVSTAAALFTKGSVTVKSVSGRYRVTINGIQADRETSDDIFNADGQHDEVYASAYVQVFDRKSRALLRPGAALATAVHGDVAKWPDRVQAGSVTSYGGIRGTDRIPAGTNPGLGSTGAPSTTTFPFLLFEGPLTDGIEVLIIRPVLWEFDGDREGYTRWKSFLEASSPDATITYAPLQTAIGAQAMTVLEAGQVANLSAWNKIGYVGCCGQLGPGQDMPIGMHPSGSSTTPAWHDRIVVITREQIELVLSSQYVTGAAGIIAIPLVTANPYGTAPLWGDYVVYLRVERIP